jgi:hypothetical protein
MPRRTLFVLLVDSAMLALVCVLECLDLTGLELHEWLGFALCPLVLVHVVLQWPWFATQFRKFLRAPAARVRINALLNTLLLVTMSAVLLSGVLNSGQVISLIGEPLGRARVWRELHGWLNFTALVLVGLHLSLNWDWLMGVFTRRRRERPALAADSLPGALRSFAPFSSSHGLLSPTLSAKGEGEATTQIAQSRTESRISPGARFINPAGFCRRALATFAAAALSAAITYFAMAALLGPSKDDPDPPRIGRAQPDKLAMRAQ